ncbi:MAG TPA: RidA family protein [Anaerolineae bacterium]|nr:RidA family protein [Anaerolineae bacterium]
MDRTIVSTDKAPGAAGPYSQAVVVGDLVFTAGAIALDPKTGEMVGEEIGAQTRQVLKNVQGVLEAAGSSLDRVVKTTVFLTDMGNFAQMNSVYAEFFPSDPPARTTVEVGPLAKGALLEMEAIALRS